MCEEFGGFPTRALWELKHDPDGLASTVMMLRAYARTKAAIDAADDESKAPTGEMADLVAEIESEIVKEEHEAKIAERLRKLGATLGDDDVME